MSKQRGFTLVEMLIVIVIIGIILAIGVPGLVRARQYAQSGSAIQTLRTVTTAQVLYYRRHQRFATLTELAPEGTIDDHIAAGQKSGYNFVLTVTIDPHPPGEPDVYHFSCTAAPILDTAHSKFFYVDDTCVIRSNLGAPATLTSEPIPD
jgi:prepilin-type N-terminal cleavage/methylation domain-containing protein